MAVIRNWDNANNEWLFLPVSERLQYGNVAPYNAGNAPLLRGPSAVGTETATLTNMGAGFGIDRTGACLFDGVDDFVNIDNSKLLLTNASVHTFDAWVFRKANGVNETIVGASDGGLDNWTLLIGNTNKTAIRIRVGGVAYQAISSDVVTPGAWHQLGFKKNGAALTLQIDGADVSGYDTQVPYNGGNYNFTDETMIGDDAGGNFTDSIAWAGMYNAVLSGVRTLQHHTSGFWFDGLRGTVDGSKIINPLIDPADDVPALPPGEAWQFKDSTYAAPGLYRNEYVTANQTDVPTPFTEGHVPDSVFDNCSQLDGSDVVITTVAGVEIPIDVAAFSRVDRTCLIWIKIPTLSTAISYDFIWQCGGAAGNRDIASTIVWEDDFGGALDHALMHHYQGNANDATVNANNGALQNAPANVPAVFGMGYDLDGINQYIRVLDDTSLSYLLAPCTMLAWIKADVTAAFAIITKYNDANKEYIHTLDGGEYQAARLYDNSSGGRIGRRYTVNVLASKWLLCSFTYDGGALVGGIKVYANGTQVDNLDNSAGAFAGMENKGANVEIGARSTGALYSNGIIAHPQMISGEVGANDILTKFNSEWTAPVNGAFDIGEAVIFPIPPIPPVPPAPPVVGGRRPQEWYKIY